MDSATSRTLSQPCGMQMLTSEHVTDKCHARVATFLLPQRKFANLQILPRSREEDRSWQKLCQREDTGLPWGKPYRVRKHIWDYPKGNQAIRTPSPVQGLTRDPGELTSVLGLASDCSAQSDCRGCLEDSTRVHHPGNWTGGEKMRSHPRVRGNGAASVTPASSSRPLPVTQHTGMEFPFDESERIQERCLKRQELQLDWVQRLKWAPLKSSRDDREVPRGYKGWPRGIHPPGTLQEPHDEIMLSQGPAIHCIVMGRDNGHIHFQCGGWQLILQHFLQEGKHYSNRASSGVFSAKRKPVREQTPLQCIGLPCWRSTSLSDGLYHCQW